MLARINGAIESRRAAGEALPPPPKTAIAGPEYFGLTHPAILPRLEALDAAHICVDYWAGKQVNLTQHLLTSERDAVVNIAPAAVASTSVSRAVPLLYHVALHVVRSSR